MSDARAYWALQIEKARLMQAAEEQSAASPPQPETPVPLSPEQEFAAMMQDHLNRKDDFATALRKLYQGTGRMTWPTN